MFPRSDLHFPFFFLLFMRRAPKSTLFPYTTLFRSILDAAEELGRHVFSVPTFYYKTGVAFLSWLNGHQPAFTMVGGLHSARSLPHLSKTIELAATTGNLEDPALAAERWHAMLRLAGFDVPEGSTR